MFKINIFRLFGVAAFLVCLALTSFAQGGGIKGKVRSSKGGAIANATITARLDGKEVKTVRSDAKGDFVLKGLDSGVYNVVFDADGYSSGVKYGVEIKNNNIRDLGDRLILSIDQGTLVIIKGSVFFKEGTSVTGAKVELERVNADGSTKRVATEYTNVSGEFTFKQPEGPPKFRITAKFKDASGTKDIEVANAAIYRLAISLDISRQDR